MIVATRPEPYAVQVKFDGDYLIVSGDWTIICKSTGPMTVPIYVATLSSHHWSSVAVKKDPQ